MTVTSRYFAYAAAQPVHDIACKARTTALRVSATLRAKSAPDCAFCAIRSSWETSAPWNILRPPFRSFSVVILLIYEDVFVTPFCTLLSLAQQFHSRRAEHSALPTD